MGVAGSSAYQTTREQKLAVGQSMTVAGNTFTFRGIEHGRSATANETRAVLDISGASHGTLRTGVNDYFTGDTSRDVGIHTNWLRAQALYATSHQPHPTTLSFTLLVHPLLT